ncbi:UNVERIFIED_CONTAM: putative mitochondrial protein [Sesamum radiatum]|uniref:Mitochondrial protein n=1 Tax=Sesamum radiatum TaxID=300843 RepID=A0AAW2K632_SESRA
MEHLACRIDYVTAQALAQPFTKEEVVRALFQMAPLKSPGPDGMPPLFFQRFWPSVQGDVVPCVLALLNNHVMPRSLNDTHIVLIPKCRKPESLSQCRPISLCNVLYKIASKSIANRFKPFLETIISPTQAAFVPGRLITNNILLAYELNHFMRNKNWGKMGHIALKLDISKAYDKVEWNFLKHVLLRLGFPPRLVDLMLCVSSVCYSFLINGHEFASLTPQRGLRQGDPLSPYLFLLYTEALSSLVGRLEHEGILQGLSVCRNAPPISHILFVDDTLIFSQASEEAMRGVARMLEIYAQALGQAINLNKSFVVFSRNVNVALQDLLANSLGNEGWTSMTFI